METTEMDLQNAEQNKSSRRAAILMGGAALAGMALARKAEAQNQGSVLDTALLNFALNLEYLEAEFYTLATQGKTLAKVGAQVTGNSGAVGGLAVTPGTVTTKNNNNYASCLVPFVTPNLQAYAMETAQDERNHVAFLQTAITNASSIAEPNIDLFNSFNGLAVAAGLLTAAQVTAGASFDPFASEGNFLLGAFIFEDVGVTAYHGAAGLITSKTILDKAAGILAVEAYHAGSIRTQIYGSTATVTGLPPGPPVTLQAASQAIAATRALLDGTGPTAPDDIGVTTLSNGAATVLDGDANAIAFARTTLQVRQIVYAATAANAAAGKGGFFPTGMLGPIN